MPPQRTPGPGSHSLKPLVGYNDHDFSSVKRRAPQWSMGGALRGLSQDRTPGAANYDTRKLTRFGKYPNVPASMAQKLKDLKSDQGPGSNRYNAIDVTLFKARGGSKYSIGIRTKEIDGQCGPGPVSNLVPLDVYKNRAPKYPFLERTKELSDGKSPGPNQYSTDVSKQKTMKTNPVYSMRVRTADLRADKVPGPAEYDLNRHNPFESAPSYSLRRRHSEYTNVLVLPSDYC